ncbi:MAG: DEAD/DEAH box helicase [Desulfobacca sp.]|nr:DEAD/DEAH box helicase [Desulfobacca sp.]
MIILHAGWYDHQLVLWGETPSDLASPGPKPRGRQSKVPKPPKLIFDAGAERLNQALGESGITWQADKNSINQVTAWLPTLNDQPLASSSLIADLPEPSEEIRLAPWQITALRLPVAVAVEFLCRGVNQEILGPGLLLGPDLVFWITVLRWAGSLVARQQFLPSLKMINGGYVAGWEPVITGGELNTQASLAAAMPHACRALSREWKAPPDTPAAGLLTDFLGRMVDYLVRTQEPGPIASRTSRTRAKPSHSFDSSHDHWLHALQSPDGLMIGQPGELEELAAQIETWKRPMALTTTTPFRLCFRLEEPSEAEARSLQVDDAFDRWYVRLLLQAVDDPSLFIPTAEAWQAQGSTAALLCRDNFNVQEYLLFSLGQSARICPALTQSLKSTAPGGVEISTAEALEFLTEKALLLEQSGYRVLLPAWWTPQGTRSQLTVRAQVASPKFKTKAGLSLDQIVRFQWQVALGGEALSEAELEALVRLKSPLVKVRGQWVMLNAEEMQAALEFWKKKGSAKATVRELINMSLGGRTAAAGLACDGIKTDGWLRELLDSLQGRAEFAELPVPKKFQGTLRPYQVRGYSWLSFLRQWGLGACLADDMGLGKTIQTLALILRDWQLDHPGPVLLICPTSVVGNWQKEAARFTPDLPVMVHHGLTRARGKSFLKQIQKHAMVISSYALMHRDFELLQKVPWSGVILDEAQNIKNPETKQAKAARALKADYRLALTGTPVENNVGDLWSIMEFLNPGHLGSQTEFKRRFFIPIQAYRQPEATERLQRLTAPFILRRLKTDKSIIADLPEKNEMLVYCHLTKEQASLYAAVVEEMIPSLDQIAGIQRKGLILATLLKLKQVCNHPAQFLGDNSPIPGRSGKLSRLTEMLEEVIVSKDRALIFTQFTEMGKILQHHLQETFGREVLFLHGSLTKKQRDLLVERFQRGNGQTPLFILSLKAGGTGLNLTAANHVFHFDRWWNPAVENQATDRAFRIGQRKDVQVHKFVCLGTLEESISDLIERKQEVAEKVVGTGEGWLTELSTTKLKKLFSLRPSAVGE